MNYEEKYNEILEWARKNKARLNGVPIEEVLPELAESEDERIRRKMLEHFRSKTKETWCNIPVKDIIAYLEKQKEQKPEWSEEDERMIGRMRSVVNECASYNDALDVNGDYCEGDYAKLDAWLKSLPLNLKKKNEDVAKLCSKEWSVEDEDRIRQIERIAQQAGCTQKLQEEIHNWLKSLRPSWKPSEEQMEELQGSITYLAIHNMKVDSLVSLHKDLHKLM